MFHQAHCTIVDLKGTSRNLRRERHRSWETAMKPREIIHQIENNPALPAGEEDRFAGYAVMGVPFRSGHILALRRFPASSVGPAYTSVWHRDPRGMWTFYSTVNPEMGCSRYFGAEITYNCVVPIEIR